MDAQRTLRIALACILASGCLAAHAQSIRPAYSFPVVGSQEGTSDGTGAASIRIGESPFFFSPFMGVGVGHDDNLFFRNSDKFGSNFEVYSPGFRIDARTAATVLQIDHQSQYGVYNSSRADDYQDHVTHGTYDMAFGGRTFFRLGYDYIRGHDPRGSTDRGVSDTPDVYKLSVPSATFAYGAPGARGRVELYYSDAHKDYLNNKDRTFASDRVTEEMGGAFYLRVAPKTYAMAEVREVELRYDQPDSPFSGREHRYYAGISWEATAATTGTFKFGRLEKSFVDESIPSYTGTSWEGIVVWAPRTYSTFTLSTSRQTSESTGLGNFILTDAYSVVWNHAWSSRVNTGVLARYQRDAYQGFDRRDETKSLGLKVGYRFRRWLTLGAEYDYTTRDSNLDTFDYNKSIYLLTATMSL